jgi:hypothetical protein
MLCPVVQVWMQVIVILSCFALSSAADVGPVYEPPDILAAKDIPGLTLRCSECAAAWAVQFGPGRKDVRRYTRHDRLHVYHPDLFPKPKLLGGKWRDGVMAHSPVTVDATFDNAVFTAILEAEVSTKWQQPEAEMRLTVRADLRDERPASFLLIGNLPAAMGAARMPEPCVLLARPFLRVSWDRRTEPISVRGVLQMGPFRLIPDSGITAKGTLEILGAIGQSVESAGFRPRCSQVTGYFRCGAPRRIRPLTPYLARVRIALPPIADLVEGNAAIVIPES